MFMNFLIQVPLPPRIKTRCGDLFRQKVIDGRKDCHQCQEIDSYRNRIAELLALNNTRRFSIHSKMMVSSNVFQRFEKVLKIQFPVPKMHRFLWIWHKLRNVMAFTRWVPNSFHSFFQIDSFSGGVTPFYFPYTKVPVRIEFCVSCHHHWIF